MLLSCQQSQVNNAPDIVNSTASSVVTIRHLDEIFDKRNLSTDLSSSLGRNTKIDYTTQEKLYINISSTDLVVYVMKLKGHYLNSNRERFILGQSFDNPFTMTYTEAESYEDFLLNGKVQYTLNIEDITIVFNNLQIIETVFSEQAKVNPTKHTSTYIP